MIPYVPVGHWMWCEAYVVDPARTMIHVDVDLAFLVAKNPPAVPGHIDVDTHNFRVGGGMTIGARNEPKPPEAPMQTIFRIRGTPTSEVYPGAGVPAFFLGAVRWKLTSPLGTFNQIGPVVTKFSPRNAGGIIHDGEMLHSLPHCVFSPDNAEAWGSKPRLWLELSDASSL